MMNKWLKSIMCIGFALMFCFLTVGYAALNDQLYVSGTVSYDAPEPTEPTYPTVGTFYLRHNDKTVYSYAIKQTGINSYQVILDLPKDGKYEDRFSLNSLPLESGKYHQLDDTSGNSIDSGTSWRDFLDKKTKAGKYVLSFTITKSGKDYIGIWSISSYSSAASVAFYSLDTSNVQNLSISSTEATTFDLESLPNLLLTLTPDEGYLLPESFTVTIGETVYTIYTNGENELDTMFFDTESSTLYILGDILPTDGSAVTVTAYAIPEVPPYTVQTALENMSMDWYTADNGLYMSLATAEGYLLPESFTVTIGETAYAIYTTAEDAAEEGQPSVKNNPAGMGYDTVANKLFISAALIPEESCIVLTGAAVCKPEEETVPTITVESALENMTMGWNTGENGLYIRLTPDEGYRMPEAFTVTIGGTGYTIYTTGDDAAEDGRPSVKDNPAGMGYALILQKSDCRKRELIVAIHALFLERKHCFSFPENRRCCP